jgi:hypothetical protein
LRLSFSLDGLGALYALLTTGVGATVATKARIPVMTERFDAIVIGMGPGGEVAVSRLLAAGSRLSSGS